MTMENNFIKCGITGWCLEVLFTSADSILHNDKRLVGRTSLWMFPIYGLGALIRPIAALLKRQGMLIRGFIYMVLIFFTEYVTGAFLRAKNMCPWDYSRSPYNVDGLIRLDFAPLWFLVGLLFERITRKG